MCIENGCHYQGVTGQHVFEAAGDPSVHFSDHKKKGITNK